MYNMSQRLPAPYELNNSIEPRAYDGSFMARGGKAHKYKGMSTVHMNRNELNILDHLQGRAMHGPGGVKVYTHLEELLKNPHIVHSVHHHARHHHMDGELAHLAQGGRYGDNDVAMIGPHTEHLFNQLAGHPTRNPYTGHPEYFSIGGALKGLWNTVKGIPKIFAPAVKHIAPAVKQIAQTAAPALIPMAQQALESKFGDKGKMVGNMMQAGADSMLGAPPEDVNPYYQAIGQGIGNAAQRYRSGTRDNPVSLSQAFGHGLRHVGSEIGGGLGNALEESGQSLGEGQDFGQAARRGGHRFYNDMGGREGMYEAAQNVGMGLMNRGMAGARQAANNQMSQYMQKALPGYDPFQEAPQGVYA